MPSMLVMILKMFSGPLSQMAEKAIFAGVLWLLTKGNLDTGSATQIAASIYAVFSLLFSAITGTQTLKFASVNDANNGAVVVAASDARAAGIQPVTTPVTA